MYMHVFIRMNAGTFINIIFIKKDRAGQQVIVLVTAHGGQHSPMGPRHVADDHTMRLNYHNVASRHPRT
jgi:hypothetical protein